jgi:hypothetical protein
LIFACPAANYRPTRWGIAPLDRRFTDETFAQYDPLHSILRAAKSRAFRTCVPFS